MTFKAGAAASDISPHEPVALFGYPHVQRISTGVHDPLLASVLYLENGPGAVVLVALDLLFLDPPTAVSIRRAVARRASVPEECVFISCTHTHSGPVTGRMLSWQDDLTIPGPDSTCLQFIEQQVVDAAGKAVSLARPAEIAWSAADASGVGGNRLDPDGVTDPEVGVLAVREAENGTMLAMAVIYGMHPTVLHEDSTLVSSDFPHYTRQHLQERFGENLTVLYHNAPCGDQSTRHFVDGQTFQEAERLGRKLGKAVAKSLGTLQDGDFKSDCPLSGVLQEVELTRRTMPSIEEAQKQLDEYRAAYKRLKVEQADRAEVRTAECAVFGAEGTVTLALAQQQGKIEKMLEAYRPIQVQVLQIGDAYLVGLPGELFVEYSLKIKQLAPAKTFVVSLVGGELQGYIVTPQAAAAGGYEATNSIFAPQSGAVLVDAAVLAARGLAAEQQCIAKPQAAIQRNMAKILVIDLGTTYFKIALFDRDGQLCGVCRLAPPIRRPQPGYMELDADVFADTIAEGIAQLRGRVDGNLSDVEAVTFATQTNSFLLLDADNRPITPIVLWLDRRAAELESEVGRRCEIPEFTATTGVPQINHQFMAAKLLWLQRKFPRAWQQMNKLCLISDYLTLLLTGRHVTEAGAAGLTGLLDIHRCRWWTDMLARFEINGHCLPEVVRAGTDIGRIDPKAAERFGLPANCRFVVGCLDQYAGAIGVGNVEPGMISETTGTALATVRCTDRPADDLKANVFQGPAFAEGLYYRMIFSLISAGYLQWYRDRLPDRPDFEQLTAQAAEVESGAGGLKLKTDVEPTDAGSIEEMFEGMTSRHTRGHAVRCIMETVAGALHDQVATISGGSMPDEIRSAGGAARSELWLQIKAERLGVTIIATKCPEPTSLGAAIIAESSLCKSDVSKIARQWVQLTTE